jgi:hypothetical protein
MERRWEQEVSNKFGRDRQLSNRHHIGCSDGWDMG